MVNPWDTGTLTRQEQLQMVIDTMPEPLLLVDAGLRLVACNTAGIRAAVELSGRVPRAGEPAEGLLPGGLRFAESPAVQSAFAGAAASVPAEATALAGEPRSYVVRFWPAIVEDDTVRVIGVLFHDVSAFTRSEQRLRRAENALRQLVEHAPVIIFALSADGVVQYAEGGALDRLLVDAATLGGRDLFRGETQLTGITRDAEGIFHATLALDDHAFTVRYAAIPGEGDAVRGYVGVALDVSADARQDRTEALAMRHESLARLARGLSHDLGNILTVLVGNGTMLRDMLTDDDTRMLADEIVNASWRTDAVVRQLVSFADGRPLSGPPTAIDPNAVVEETIRLVRGFIAGRATLDVRLDREAPAVLGEGAPLRELLSILLTNAIEAGGDPISVRISTAVNPSLDSGPGTVQLPASLPPAPRVAIIIEDDGRGMDAATLDLIFDPYFSTRFSGRGLGLANALGIVKAFDGAIHVRSAPGEGATVTVLLPAAR